MTQLVSDNFTRANSTGLGVNWTVVTGRGTFDIVSNKAVPHDVTADSVMFNNTVSWPNDQYSEITVGAVPSVGVDLAGIGCAVRASSSAATFYSAFATGTGGNLYLRKTVAGAGTGLGSFAIAVIVGDKIRLTASGTTLTASVNGVTKITVTDASIASGSAGMRYSSQDTPGTDSVSLWTGGDLSVGPAPPITSIPPKRRTYVFYDIFYPR